MNPSLISGRRRRAFCAVLLCFFFLSEGARSLRAADENPALTILTIAGGAIAAVEGINLLIHLFKKISLDRKKRIAQNNLPATNIPPWVPPKTNRIIAVPAVTNVPAFETDFLVVAAVETNTNRPPVVSGAVFSNLNETERRDVMMFGWDYYYLVALAYYDVKKYDKAREFMFHSIAIGMKIEEARAFLKEKFRLKDAEIGRGVGKYRGSRQ